ATSGKILFEGKDILRQAPAEQRRLRGDMQVVFQDPVSALNPKLTVGHCIAEPLTIAGYGRAEKRKRVDELLDLVGLLPAYKSRFPNEMSGGQRQRVALGRALAIRPDILLLDEPTSALDASVQAEVLNLLEQVRSDRGLTFLMVSHDLAVINHMCGRLMVMQAGETVENLDASDLATHHVSQVYTRRLLKASEGFVRDTPTRRGGCGHGFGQAHVPLPAAIGAEIETGQAGANLEFDQVKCVVRLDAQVGREYARQAEFLHEVEPQRPDSGIRLSLDGSDRRQVRLAVALFQLRGCTRIPIEREAVLHSLEVAAGIDEEDAKGVLRRRLRIDGQQADPHIATRNIGQDDGIVAVARKDAPA
ncbi:hypothetical protein COL154_014204, partial [Colletotrichum chrysophilum]